MSTARYPQVDGLIESVYESMQQYALLHLDQLSDWVSYLPMIDFDYNSSTNETSTHFLVDVSHQHQPATLVHRLLQVIGTPVIFADDRLSNFVNA